MDKLGPQTHGAYVQETETINVVPMLDIAWVLLIIFVIISASSVQGFRIGLPEASSVSQLREASDNILVVVVVDERTIRIDEELIGLDDLQEYFHERVDSQGKILRIEAVPNASYQTIIDIMDAASTLEFESIHFATRPRV